jgi:alkanesulfonate monooxygenase SsuD/methylene tetrahydromethanopterin reductase-like flavin-dependent oxidoreductase (luciferase family)
MKIAIALPETDVVAAARRAEEAGYDAVVALDRPGAEPLATLAAAAAVTERIELVTTLVMRPERTTALLAKQAATIDELSGGRLTLGVELGAGPEDYAGAIGPISQNPGRRLAMYVDALRTQWSGRVVAGSPDDVRLVAADEVEEAVAA